MNKERGFTLTETMVVVVVFTVVMSFSLVVFLGTIRVQRAALFQQRLTSEVSYVMQLIEKEIRSGEKDKDYKEYFSKSYVEGLISSETISINSVKTVRNNDRITVLIDSSIKVDEKEENDIHFKLQSTAIIR